MDGNFFGDSVWYFEGLDQISALAYFFKVSAFFAFNDSTRS